MTRRTAEAMQAVTDMWAAVDAVRSQRKIVPKPKNGFTQEQYAQRYGIPASTAEKQVRRLVQQGKLAEHYCMLPDSHGSIRERKVYTVA